MVEVQPQIPGFLEERLILTDVRGECSLHGVGDGDVGASAVVFYGLDFYVLSFTMLVY